VTAGVQDGMTNSKNIVLEFGEYYFQNMLIKTLIFYKSDAYNIIEFIRL